MFFSTYFIRYVKKSYDLLPVEVLYDIFHENYILQIFKHLLINVFQSLKTNNSSKTTITI